MNNPTHGVFFINNDNEVFHVVAFWHEPTDHVLRALVLEVASEEELGMTNLVYGEDYEIAILTGEKWDSYWLDLQALKDDDTQFVEGNTDYLKMVN